MSNLFWSFAMNLHPVGLNDLYMFDPNFMKWTRLDQNIFGIAPIGRYELGFTAAGSWLCLFGGTSTRNAGVALASSVRRLKDSALAQSSAVFGNVQVLVWNSRIFMSLGDCVCPRKRSIFYAITMLVIYFRL